MIREAKIEDLPHILTIYNDAIVHTTAVYTYEPETLAMREQWFNQKVRDGYQVIVYERNQTVVGFATFGPFRNWPAYKYSIEHSLYTDPRYRKEGIASSLLNELILLANQREYKTIIAGIDASNVPSIALHQKFGFTYAGTIKNAGYKFERWLDLSFYQLELEGPPIGRA